MLQFLHNSLHSRDCPLQLGHRLLRFILGMMGMMLHNIMLYYTILMHIKHKETKTVFNSFELYRMWQLYFLPISPTLHYIEYNKWKAFFFLTLSLLSPNFLLRILFTSTHSEVLQPHKTGKSIASFSLLGCHVVRCYREKWSKLQPAQLSHFYTITQQYVQEECTLLSEPSNSQVKL